VDNVANPNPKIEQIRQFKRDRQEKYHRLFTTALGKEVLEDMKRRAFCYGSTMQGNAPQHIRDAREGMRDFTLETQAWVDAVQHGQQPAQAVATSDTVEESP